MPHEYTDVTEIEFGSPDQEKMLFSTLRLSFLWLSTTYITPKSLNRVSKTDREAVIAIERKGNLGCFAGRGGWSYEAGVLGMWQVAQQQEAGSCMRRGGGGGMWLHLTDHTRVTSVKDAP
jgi:hypothetical protein